MKSHETLKSWIFLNFLELSWAVMNFQELSWTFLNFHETLKILNFRKLSWTFMNFHELSRTFKNFQELSWNFENHEFLELLWTFVNFCELSWTFMNNFLRNHEIMKSWNFAASRRLRCNGAQAWCEFSKTMKSQLFEVLRCVAKVSLFLGSFF